MKIKWLRKNKKIGLALGGGAALGAAHIGVFRAFDELGLQIYCISGNSIGAYAATLFAFGINWKEQTELSNDMKWLEVSNISISKYGLLTNKKIGQKIVKAIGDEEFKNARIPLAIVASNLNTGVKIILKEGKVADAVMASTAIPGVFRPVEIDGKLLVDGGIVENVPVSPLLKMGAEITIGVNLNGKRKYKKPENLFSVLINSYYTLIDNLSKVHTNKADLVIEPDLSAYSLIDTRNSKKLIEIGYEEAKKALTEYFF
ncbi:MAG: patatin-like phospholipase family protein [Bacteroidales bacterium]|jgi:NTE family protein|nr:patatin-like phospholipase family protein [Bacteroidales bacterium]